MSGGGQPRRSRSLFRTQLSLGSGAAGSGQLDPALRAALAQPRSQPSGPALAPATSASFAAWAALSADRPEATLAMFRRLSSGQPGGSADARASKPAHPQQDKGLQVQGVPAPGSDSARHTEAETEEAGSPASLDSSVARAAVSEDSWAAGSSGSSAGGGVSSGAPPRMGQPSTGRVALAADQQEPQHVSKVAGASSVSVFAPAAERQFSTVTIGASLPPSPPSTAPPRPPSVSPQKTSQLRAELLLQLPSARMPAASAGSLHSSAGGTNYYSTADGGRDQRRSTGSGASSLAGWEEAVQQDQQRQQRRLTLSGDDGADTPLSAVSWVSAALTLPQTEADLAQMDWKEVEQMAAEAAELQQRAALALRLARQRMHGSSGGAGGGWQEGAGLESYVPGLVFRPAGASGEGDGGVHPPHKEEGTVGSTGAEASEGREAAEATKGKMVAEASQGQPGAAQAAGQVALSKLPSLFQAVLRLLMLISVLVEAVLLWCAALAERASNGALRMPRQLVLAPASALRGGVLATAVVAELLAELVRLGGTARR